MCMMPRYEMLFVFLLKLEQRVQRLSEDRVIRPSIPSMEDNSWKIWLSVESPSSSGSKSRTFSRTWVFSWLAFFLVPEAILTKVFFADDFSNMCKVAWILLNHKANTKTLIKMKSKCKDVAKTQKLCCDKINGFNLSIVATLHIVFHQCKMNTEMN